MVVDGQKGPWAKSQGPEGMEAREVPDVPCLGAQDHQFLGMVRLKKCGFRMN